MFASNVAFSSLKTSYDGLKTSLVKLYENDSDKVIDIRFDPKVLSDACACHIAQGPYFSKDVRKSYDLLYQKLFSYLECLKVKEKIDIFGGLELRSGEKSNYFMIDGEKKSLKEMKDKLKEECKFVIFMAYSTIKGELGGETVTPKNVPLPELPDMEKIMTKDYLNELDRLKKIAYSK